MKRQTKILVFLTSIILISSVISASMILPANEHAKEKSPVIGDNGELERVDFIHYAKPTNPGKPSKDSNAENCYKLLGVKWKSLPVGYVINPANLNELSEEFVTSAISESAEVWDDSTSKELFNDLFGVNYNAHYGVQNFVNEIDFGTYPESNVIAVTSIWYTRRGKQIVEFDMRFNSVFNWGDSTTTSGVMDLKNIATHELGHAVGMGDIYTSTCSDVTMYGYASYGETSKRTLEIPDVTGLQSMYGM